MIYSEKTAIPTGKNYYSIRGQNPFTNVKDTHST